MYTVGEFSKICQVSVKTLHYYDRIGLLPPLTVDAETGYLITVLSRSIKCF